MRFNIWVIDGSKERWTIASGCQFANSPKPFTWKEVKGKLGGILVELKPRIREVLPDGSPGAFYDQDPDYCPQCGEVH
jgi:hypothetical protein